MRPSLVVLTILLALAGAAALSQTPDTSLGLSKTSVFDVPAPEPVRDPTADPGDTGPLPRAYAKAPPLIPHAIADMLPITRDDNLCMDCHMIEEAGEGEPTPIPKSHYTDLRRAPGVVGETVAGARYNCVACHVAPTGAKPLVGNTFTEAP